MIVSATTISFGVKRIQSLVHHDDRGRFVAAMNFQDFDLGGFKPVAQNISVSHAGVLRGLHAQVPHQAKLVRCISGRIIDFVVDSRPDSPTFGEHLSVILDDPRVSLLVPRGLLHGFISLSPNSVVEYHVDNPYNPEHQIRVNWDSCGILWREVLSAYGIEKPIISPDDSGAPSLHRDLFRETRPLEPDDYHTPPVRGFE